MGRSIGTSRPSADDRTLLERVRRGDRSAYAELYERHVDSARRYARTRLSNPADVDDAVADVFASVLSTIEGGKGPVDGFAPYLIASLRHQCARLNRHARRERAEDVEADRGHDATAAAAARDELAAVDDAGVVREAYESLPARFREVLWQTEIAGKSHEQIARQIGSTPRAIAVLASRARQALAAAYLERHLSSGPAAVPSRACRHVLADLAEVVRGTAGGRRLRRVEEHLPGCADCRAAHDSLSRMNDHLRALPLLPVGALGATALKSELEAKAKIVAWISTPMAKVAAGSVVVASVIAPVAVHERWFAPAPAPPPPASPGNGTSGVQVADANDTRVGTRTGGAEPTTASSGAATAPEPNPGTAGWIDSVLSALVGGNVSRVAEDVLPDGTLGQLGPPPVVTVTTPVTVSGDGAAISLPASTGTVASIATTIPTVGAPTPSLPVVGSLPPALP